MPSERSNCGHMLSLHPRVAPFLKSSLRDLTVCLITVNRYSCEIQFKVWGYHFLPYEIFVNCLGCFKIRINIIFILRTKKESKRTNSVWILALMNTYNPQTDGTLRTRVRSRKRPQHINYVKLKILTWFHRKNGISWPLHFKPFSRRNSYYVPGTLVLQDKGAWKSEK